MKTLVVVIAHPQAAPILDTNWPWLQKCGCDIAVVNHAGSGFFALDPHPRFNPFIGGPPMHTINRWVDRFLEVLTWCTSDPATEDYDYYVLTEADSIFLRPVPDLPFGFCATHAGYRSPGFNAPHFYHAPWCMDHDSAIEFIRRAKLMLNYGVNESGYIDRFIGAYANLFDVQIHNLAERGLAHTRNTIEGNLVAEAREHAKDPNCFFMHGIKTPAVLACVTGGLGL